MRIHFPKAKVVALVAHTKAAKEHKPLYGQPSKASLWLVGDQGVYLMSSAKQQLPEKDPNRVIYCKESDPTDGGDDWYDNKRAIFGGDDGVESLPIEDVEKALAALPAKAKWFVMNVSPTTISF